MCLALGYKSLQSLQARDATVLSNMCCNEIMTVYCDNTQKGELFKNNSKMREEFLLTHVSGTGPMVKERKINILETQKYLV